MDTAKYCAVNPRSDHDFLMNRAVAVCTDENPTTMMTEMLGIEDFESISPKNWFLNACGPDSYNQNKDE